MKDTDLVVIGGGAAGMLASAFAAKRGISTVLLEPNKKLGKKLRITGNGRCNLTNNCDIGEFINNVVRNGRFLYSALSRFSPSDAMAFFEGLGITLKTESGKRVFPASDSGEEVARVLTDFVHGSGVKVLRAAARKILAEEGAVSAVVTTNDETIKCRAAILCTGCLSYPGTGSKGDGYIMARELGHNVTPLGSSLVPLVSKEDYCREMQGLSLKNVRLTALDGKGKVIFQGLGEMIFTHFGVSGPLVLSASARMADYDKEVYRLSIDLYPGLDEKRLDEMVLSQLAAQRNRDVKNALDSMAGRMMIPLLRLSGIPAETKANSVTREQRWNLVRLLKAFPVTVAGPRPVEEAVITRGGVDVRQVNPKTMESKLVKGLYFAGEILDVDAYTGGFNLQIAWSTGYAAGNSVFN